LSAASLVAIIATLATAPEPPAGGDTQTAAGEPTPDWLRSLLGVLGVVLVAIAVGAWLWPEDDSTKTVSEASTTAVESTASPTTTDAAGAAQPGTGTSTTQVDKTTTTTTPPASRRSGAVIAALLGIGAVLVFAGVFANRLASLKFPGGEMTVTPVGAKVAEALASKTTPETPAQKRKVRAAYVLALDELSAYGTSPGDDEIDEVTSRALRSVRAPDFE
jgi:hypothetical protein